MFYKNLSCIAKTFYGVTFEPGHTKEVHGTINDKMMVAVDGPDAKNTKSTQQKPSPEKPKEESVAPALTLSSTSAQPSVIKEESVAITKDDSKSGKNKKS